MMNQSRIFGLDLLRAIAICQVMFTHGSVYSNQLVSANHYRWVILDGVGLFFVLSGFLIGGLFIREADSSSYNTIDLFRFYMRRWMRTLPAYFTILTILIVLYQIKNETLPPSYLHYYFFTQNLFTAHPLFFGEAWSLSVEEWFYLVIPFLLFLYSRFRGSFKYSSLLIIVIVIMAVTILRWYKLSQHDYFADHRFGEDILKVVVTRLDGIMYGVLAAWLKHYYPIQFGSQPKRLFIGGCALFLISNILFTPFYHTHFQYSVTPLATAMLLPLLVTFRSEGGKVYKVVTFISSISYSMYLVNHMLVIRALLPLVSTKTRLLQLAPHWHQLISLFLFWIFTLVLAYALYRLVEQPFNRLRENYFPAKQRS